MAERTYVPFRHMGIVALMCLALAGCLGYYAASVRTEALIEEASRQAQEQVLRDAAQAQMRDDKRAAKDEKKITELERMLYDIRIHTSRGGCLGPDDVRRLRAYFSNAKH